MISRRKFLAANVVLSAASLPAATVWAAAMRAADGPLLRLERFVFDSRFAEALETSRHAARRGIALAGMAGDLTRLWYDELDLLWKKAPMALAGITTREGLFVLETLAADRGMRVVYRGKHGAGRDGYAAHSLAGPAAVVAQAAAHSRTSPWGASLCDALTQCPLGTPRVIERELFTAAAQASSRDVPLYSWIIAPRTAVRVRV